MFRRAYPILWLTVLLGTISYSSLFRWIALEISLIIFLILIRVSIVYKWSEELIYYFRIQALGRVILLYVWISQWALNDFWAINLFYLRLTIKIGIMPFHSWYLCLINLLDWDLIWILRIPIKLITLKLLFSVNSMNLIIVVGALNIFLSSLLVLKEKKIKLFIGYSSIFNIGWGLLRIFDLVNWIIYMAVYGFNLKLLLVSLNEISSWYLFNKSMAPNKSIIIIAVIAIIVIIGLPPFSGFLLKLIVFFIIITDYLLLRTLILLISLVITFYYLIILFYRIKNSNSIFYNKSKKRASNLIYFFLGNFVLILIILNLITYYLNNNIAQQLAILII